MTAGFLIVIVRHLDKALAVGDFSYRVAIQGAWRKAAKDIAMCGFSTDAEVADFGNRLVYFPPSVIRAVILERIATV